MAGTITARTVDGVTTILIDDPARRNALSSEMLTSLAHFMNEASGRVVVISGAGGTFTAGADLTELETEEAATGLEVRLAAAADAIANCGLPVIAAVEGPCLGAGVELAAACDIRVVSEEAFFEIPATRFGIVYRPAGLQRLQRRLDSHVIRRLLLANERVPAPAMGGFAAPLVAAGGVAAESQRLAAQISTLSGAAVAATKRLLNQIEGDPA